MILSLSLADYRRSPTWSTAWPQSAGAVWKRLQAQSEFAKRGTYALF